MLGLVTEYSCGASLATENTWRMPVKGFPPRCTVLRFTLRPTATSFVWGTVLCVYSITWVLQNTEFEIIFKILILETKILKSILENEAICRRLYLSNWVKSIYKNTVESFGKQDIAVETVFSNFLLKTYRRTNLLWAPAYWNILDPWSFIATYL